MPYTNSSDWTVETAISDKTWDIPDDDQPVYKGAEDIRYSVNQIAKTLKEHMLPLVDKGLTLPRAKRTGGDYTKLPEGAVLRKDEVETAAASAASAIKVPTNKADAWITDADMTAYPSLRMMIKNFGQASVHRMRYTVTRKNTTVSGAHVFRFWTPWSPPNWSTKGMLLCSFDSKTNDRTLSSGYGTAYMDGTNIWVLCNMQGWIVDTTVEWNLVYYDPVFTGNTTEYGHWYT